MATDARTRWSTFRGPAIFSPLIQCRPALMEHPQLAQSGSPPKTHGSTFVLKIAGIVDGHFRKQAVRGTLRSMDKCARHAFREHQLAIAPAHPRKRLGQANAILRQQLFRARFVALRGIDTEPDAVHFRTRTPEGEKLFQIAGLLEMLPHDG